MQPFIPPIIVLVVSAVCAVLATGWVRTFAHRKRIYDYPSSRSLHTVPTPRGGGIVLAGVILGGVALLFVVGQLDRALSASLLGGGVLIAAVGWLDDRRDLSPAVRAIVHAVAAAWLVYWAGGVKALHFGQGAGLVGWAATLSALLGTMWLTNLYNFMDGIDGLAASEAALVGLSAGALLWGVGSRDLGLVAFLVAGASLGFLVWNWQPAKIFMGDVGSALLGYLFASLAIFSEHNRAIPALGWLLLLGVFVVDASVTLARRVLHGEAWYRPHKTHAYQRLVQAGWSHARVVAAASALTLGLVALTTWTVMSGGAIGAALSIAAMVLGSLYLLVERVSPRARSSLPSGREVNRRSDRYPMEVRNRYLAGLDIAGCCGALALAYVVRFESFAWPPEHRLTFLRFLPIAIGVKFGVFYQTGLYRRLWRHAGVDELERILSATAAAGVATFFLGVSILPALGYLDVRVPISIAVLDAVLTAVVIAGPRFFFRWASHRSSRVSTGEARRVLIAGAGAAGELIAKELYTNPALGLTPVGYVDDDEAKHGKEMCGLRVLGPLAAIPELRGAHRIEQLIIAMPSASGHRIREAVRKAQIAGLETRTIPGMFEILSGRLGISSLRPIQIEDLLRREPVRTDLDRVQALIDERTVLVTGAGGSIGSELSRQLAALQPARLIALGHGENSIFSVVGELTDQFPSLDVVPVIADVRDAEVMMRVMEQYRPSAVFHAAAHKHVPLMEVNVAEAITNNVLGTRNVVVAAAECGVDHFVMISTDKAVRPTNIMGASKRVAEQIVQEWSDLRGTNFISVRFGNVLGSRGSVVPIFLRQIQSGGPVTVTHPEMRRYFMTIPEAVQLVLQAAVLGKGGEVFVLDMGEPVKIVDLATDLIRLSGLEVGRDVEIHFTGVRPGEKLYEELFFGREHAEPTEHPKLLKGKHADLAEGMSSVVEELIVRAKRGDSDYELRELLQRLVPDYHPEQSAHPVSVHRPADLPSARALRELEEI